MTKREFARRRNQEDVLLGLGFTLTEADRLRRISNTLQRWHELECGTDNGCIERGHKARNPETGRRKFVHDEKGRPYWHNSHSDTFSPMPDRETGARKRLAKIMQAHDGESCPRCEPHALQPCGQSCGHVIGRLSAYIQTDPRGAALYIIRPGDVPEGGDVSAYYDRGICVY